MSIMTAVRSVYKCKTIEFPGGNTMRNANLLNILVEGKMLITLLRLVTELIPFCSSLILSFSEGTYCITEFTVNICCLYFDIKSS